MSSAVAQNIKPHWHDATVVISFIVKGFLFDLVNHFQIELLQHNEKLWYRTSTEKGFTLTHKDKFVSQVSYL